MPDSRLELVELSLLAYHFCSEEAVEIAWVYLIQLQRLIVGSYAQNLLRKDEGSPVFTQLRNHAQASGEAAVPQQGLHVSQIQQRI